MNISLVVYLSLHHIPVLSKKDEVQVPIDNDMKAFCVEAADLNGDGWDDVVIGIIEDMTMSLFSVMRDCSMIH